MYDRQDDPERSLEQRPFFKFGDLAEIFIISNYSGSTLVTYFRLDFGDVLFEVEFLASLGPLMSTLGGGLLSGHPRSGSSPIYCCDELLVLRY